MSASIDTTASLGPWDSEDLFENLAWARRLALRLCRNASLADDVLQDAALAALSGAAPASGPSRRWLAGVVRNRLRMVRRSAARRQAREEDRARDAEQVADADLVQQAEAQNALTSAVLGLREPYRTVILQRYFHEWTPTEIADRTGTPLATVKSQLQRGLRELEGQLTSQFGSSSGPGHAGWFGALLPLAVMESKDAALLQAGSKVTTTSFTHWVPVGAVAMTIKLLAVSAAAVAAVLALRLSTGAGESASAAAVTRPLEVAEDPSSAPERATASVAPDTRRVASSVVLERQEQPAAMPATTTSEAGRCEVTGRVVDEHAHPLAQASVELSRAGDEAGPALVLTDADGRFVMQVAVPVPARANLMVTATPMHLVKRIRFGATGSRSFEPLDETGRDLGDLVLRPAATIRGRVVDRVGRPVRAKVSPELGYGEAIADVDGRYELGSVDPDVFEVNAELSGYLMASNVVALRGGEAVENVDFVLEEGRRIEGLVTGLGGQPIAGANVDVWPVSDGKPERAVTSEDGRFDAVVTFEGNAALRVEAPGYELWSTDHSHVEFDPDAGEARVRMHAALDVEFRVVDRGTQEPVERFGLRIVEENGSEGRSSTSVQKPRPKSRPGGVLRTQARDRIDQVRVVAKGYAPYAADVQTGVSEDGRVRVQTIELTRGGRIVGRLMKDGEAVPGASIELCEVTVIDDEIMLQMFGSRPVEHDGSRRRTKSAADGTFEVDELVGGTYLIRISSEVAPTLELPVAELERDGVVDLGEVALLEPGSVRGRVLMPIGIEPKGLEVSVGSGRFAIRGLVDSSGRFELRGVPPGEQKVILGGRTQRLEEGAAAVAVVEAERTTDVEIDARTFGLVHVSLTIDLGGLPTAGAEVELLASDLNMRELGTCDADGRVSGYVRAPCTANVVVLADTTSLQHPDVALELVLHEPVEQTIQFETHRVALDLGAARVLPATGTLEVVFEQESPPAWRSAHAFIENGAFDEVDPAWLALDDEGTGGTVLQVAGVLSGEYYVTVTVEDDATGAEEAWIDRRVVRVGD